ncbi:hypothetical protein CCMSSC00406_0003280 [Pleurotus cornucopiae]|uniref:Uncharacterized protein n=1 Tax=Pleurotus cornucopiae TaxID=5321 RepID=A0ACB7JAU7_PLECO|nr:hypothetical protein CCMSSC00406_0003280 [Pleurotus cornucopiae]
MPALTSSSSSTSSEKANINERRLPNPVVVIRFLAFALLVFLNFQLLVFTAWNIHAVLSVSLPVSGPTIVFIFNCCFLYLFIVFAMVEYIRPYSKTGQIKFELAWSGVISLMYLGATISLTVDGPTQVCEATKDSSICASASLLLPVAWATTLTLLTYFFGLIVLCAVHMPSYPAIWDDTVYKFPWFLHPDGTYQPYVRQRKTDEETGDASSPTSIATHGTRRRFTLDPPSWAKALNVRRGRDSPFATSGVRSGTPSMVPSSVTVAPLVPPKDLRIKVPPTPSREGSPFPDSVDNQDIPIPLPRLSAWIRADAIRGITVHTIPIPTP